MLANLKHRRLYFIGICGSGMSGLAHFFLDLGSEILGSDVNCSEVAERLMERGVEFFLGHKASHINKSIDAVIYSNAIDENNPEIKAAKSLNIPVISRAQLLFELLRYTRPIGVTGTHGKTTTTALLASILNEASLSPSLLLGGETKKQGRNGYFGKGEFLIYEACEAFASINHFFSEIAVVTNIDNDHMDYYNNMDNLLEAFLGYINRTSFYGLVVLNEDDPYIRQILEKVERPYILCGLTPNNGLYANEIEYKGFHSYFHAHYKGKSLGTFTLGIPGEHNLYNALMAMAVALHLEIPLSVIKSALENFQAPYRRFQYYGVYNGTHVIDDYAHHPTEISETLKSANNIKRYDPSLKRTIVIFQPHLYSRTKNHLKAFALALAQSDFVILCPIYASREKDLGEVSSSSLGEELSNLHYKNYVLAESLKEAREFAQNICEPDDIIITMGAGNVNTIAKTLVKEATKVPPKENFPIV